MADTAQWAAVEQLRHGLRQRRRDRAMAFDIVRQAREHDAARDALRERGPKAHGSRTGRFLWVRAPLIRFQPHARRTGHSREVRP